MFLLNKKGIDSNQIIRPVLMAALIGLAAPAMASAPVSGLLVIVNGAASVTNGSVGDSASAVKVEVKDSTGICSTTASLAYKGTVVVSWAASNTHGPASCTNIATVDVTPIKTVTGVVQYDSTANATPPAVATAPTTFTAPTTAITNLALIVTGGASAATTGSATVWGSALGVKPTYDTTNGALTTTGILGSVGSAGLKAETIMRSYAVIPKIASEELGYSQ
jgi:hypothetical protein